MPVLFSQNDKTSASRPGGAAALPGAAPKSRFGIALSRTRILRGWGWRCIFVAFAVTAAYFLRVFLQRGESELPAFITFYPVVLLAGLLDGVWGGILATLAAAFVAHIWVMAPKGQWAVSSSSDLLAIGIFTVFGVSLSVVVEALHRNREKLAQYELNAAIDLERGRAEQERRLASVVIAERERLFGVLETMPSMVSLLSKDHRVVFANNSFRQRFGNDEGKRCFDSRFGRSEPCLKCETFLPLETGMPHRWEVPLPDGSLIDKYHYPFTDSDGSSVILEVSFDITEQRRAEAELRAHRKHLEDLVRERTRQLEVANAKLEADIDQLERIQQSNAETQDKLRAALSSMTDSVIITDVAGNFVDFNDAFADFYRFRSKAECAKSVAEFSGLFDVSLPNGQPASRGQLSIARALSGERAANVEYNYRRKDTGETWTGSLSFGPIRDRSGAITGSVITARDITVAKRSEARLRRFYETDLFAILYWKIDGRVIDVNNRFLAMTGYTRSDLLAGRLNWAQITPPEYWHLDEVARRQIRETGFHFPYEKEFIRKDGTRVWGLFWAAAYEDDRTEGVSFILDISERKRAEAELAEAKIQAERSAVQLRTIFDSMEERVYVCDRDGNVIVANDVARRTYEVEGSPDAPPVSQMHQHIDVFNLDGQQLDLLEWPISRALRGERFHGAEIRVQFKNTSQSRMLSCSGASIRDEAGNIVMAVLTSADITERKANEAALRESEKIAMQHEQLQALAERLRKTREEERTRVSRDLHDQIGQILTAIKMDLMWIGKRSPEAEIQSRLKSSIELINEGVHSVRTICSGLRPRILDDLGLSAAIEWQANEFRARTGIPCLVSVPSVDATISADQTTAFFRIFQECLTNVSRHAEATRVEVCLFQNESDLLMEVEDNGKGFCESEIPASLGILGMRERAKSCGGDIQVQSSPGAGTTVSVRIPIQTNPGLERLYVHFDSR